MRLRLHMILLLFCWASGMLIAQTKTQASPPMAPVQIRPISISLEGGVQDLGFNYSYSIGNNRNTNNISLFLDTQGLFLGKRKSVGFFARYSYCFPLYEQGRMTLYSGPGACAGYVADVDSEHGAILGLCDIMGVRYRYHRNISLGLQINPTLGFKMDIEEGEAHLRGYMAGLWRSILPNIFIAYHFDQYDESRDFYPKKNFSIGIETSYNPTIYQYHQKRYIDADRFRNYDESEDWGYFSNGELFLTLSRTLGEHAKASLVMGYAGVCEDVRLIECNARGTWYFKPLNPSNDRFFVSIDGGIGFRTKEMSRPFAVFKLGMGYAMRIGPENSLEFFIRNSHHYGSPRLYDSANKLIPKENTLRSDMYITNLAFGVTLCL